MSGYPIEVEAFQNSILNLKGIQSIESGVDSLENIDSKALIFSFTARNFAPYTWWVEKRSIVSG